MTKLEEYKRNKEIERLGLPLMYIVKSTREGVESLERQTVEISKESLTKSGNCTEWKQKYKYKFDESPYETEITDGENSSLNEGHGSGFGDLWEWSYYCTLSKDDADQYAEKELQRITKTYLKPHKSIFLIENGWIDPMENRIADGYEPFGYKFTEKEAKEFCDSQGYWTDKDCYSIAYKAGNKMAKYRYTEIPFCYED